MSDEETTPKPIAIGVAPLGWRVIYFLRKPPWVREEPVAAFLMDNEYFAYPMVRQRRHHFIEKVDTKEDFALAAPGEAADAFVAEAKDAAREHRAWLERTKDERKREREVQKLVWEMQRKAEEFEATGRVMPADHAARPLLDHFSLGFRGLDEDAMRNGLAWFLAEHCTFGPALEVARSAFEQQFGAFLDAYQLPRPDSAALLRHMQRVEHVETFKFKGKVDGWKGLTLRKDPPQEACVPEGDDPELRSAAIRVFVAHCVRKAQAWDRDGVAQPRMLAVYRTWCIGFRVRPLGVRELAQALRPTVNLGKKAGTEGERVYEGVAVNMPKPGERVLRPGRGRKERS